MTMPCRWGEGGLGDFGGRVRLRRKFGLPSRLDAHEHVWLTAAAVEGKAWFWLNDTLLGGHDGSGPFEREVTALLRPRNVLTVEVEAPDGRGGLWGATALEVRCPAFLRHVRARLVDGRLHVSGEAVGTSERPLELYGLVDNRTVAYATVEPDAAGRSFDLMSTADVSERVAPFAVRVELVNGGTVWYRVEL
jgi:hypothetical protein